MFYLNIIVYKEQVLFLLYMCCFCCIYNRLDDSDDHNTEDECIRYTENYTPDIHDYFILVNIVPIKCNIYDLRNLQGC